jgi:hypothetical protein
MKNAIPIVGQWLGYFTYGEEYGEDLHGEKVQFRLFIEQVKNDEFEGKSIDLEGIGANYEVARLRGYLQGDLISFTKEYPYSYSIDDSGNCVEHKDKPHPIVSYTGNYNADLKIFSGEWELRIDIKPVGEYWLEEVSTGTWEMIRDD